MNTAKRTMKNTTSEPGTPQTWKVQPDEYSDPTKMLIDYKDHVLPITDHQIIFSDCMRENFQLGWKDYEFDEDVFLHCNITGKRSCEILNYYVQRNFGQFLQNKTLHRTMINCGVPGSTYRSHSDDCNMDKNTTTVLYMANPKWEHGWGGEFKFYDPFSRNLLHCIDYAPNRMIIFDGNFQHTAAVMSYRATMFRFTVACMYA